MDQQEPHHAAHETATMHQHLNALEEFFETYLHKKLGLHLPKGLKDFIVQYGPWLLLIGAVLGIIAMLPMLRFLFGVVPAYYGYYYHPGVLFDLEILLSFAALVMQAAAVGGLARKKLSAWRLVYYSWLLWAVGQLLILNLVTLIVGLAVGMYLLFQIREYYH